MGPRTTNRLTLRTPAMAYMCDSITLDAVFTNTYVVVTQATVGVDSCGITKHRWCSQTPNTLSLEVALACPMESAL
jgi:hypothetical protein